MDGRNRPGRRVRQCEVIREYETETSAHQAGVSVMRKNGPGCAGMRMTEEA
ncbi:hypothetical protein [Paenibacillus ehimensis]|uniref:Uncharacterized protein n=1 Tax=Paenibacillus ehimensis TaxID=79264 RepID=A0ABT8V968_9BACL|nr:hypothetical protein [Paenibacillus ehimensis]MDO3676596.1 hypothetical protein [Paenibacillus ehimensis]